MLGFATHIDHVAAVLSETAIRWAVSTASATLASERVREAAFESLVYIGALAGAAAFAAALVATVAILREPES
jgi:hypothetical protein